MHRPSLETTYDDMEVIVELSGQTDLAISTPSEDDARSKAAAQTPAQDTAPKTRVAKVEKDGRVVRAPVPEGTREDGIATAQRYISDLEEDVAVMPQGPDAPSRLTAAGEAAELVLEERGDAEAFYRRALRTDGRCAQAHESLRRLHRAAGNWRTVAQLLDQEIAQTLGDERRAQLTLALEMLVRTRSELTAGPRWADSAIESGLPTSYKRLQTLLDASRSLADRNVEEALSLRAKLRAPEFTKDTDEDGEPIEEKVGAREQRARDEWSWSEANLRRFLMSDTRRALDLMMGLFESGRREPELLEALAELLTEHREWDRLRRVYELVTDGEHARVEHFEALASLLETRYRDLPGATAVLEAGVGRFPVSRTLARRLVEILRVLDRGDQSQSLIDALGNLIEVVEQPEEKAELLYQIGRLFEEHTGQTSAAIEIFHEALTADPQHGPVLRALGRIYVRQNNWYCLADLYEKELAAPDPLPDAWRRHFQVAEIYEERLQQPAGALRHYRAALEARPNFLPALQAIVRLFSEEGDWEDLTLLLMDMVDRVRSPRRRIHLLELASRICERRLENDRLLREILERLISLDPESPRAIEALGTLYKRTSDWDKLIELHLREAGLTDDVEETATLFWQCARVADEDLHNPRRAEEYYRQALRTVPDFLPAMEGLCRLLAREGRYEDILEIAKAELEATESPRVRLRRMGAMAELLEFRLERRSQAIETVETMHELCPEEPAPVRRLIDLFSEQGAWDKVEELLERHANMLASSRDAAESWCQLGELRERKLDDESGALEAYGKCLARLPDHPHALRGALRCGGAHEAALSGYVKQVADEANDPGIQRLARRHLARAAEQSTGNPSAASEIRQAAVAESTEDREARDMLEAAYAWERNLPGLAGLWAAAGRSFEEGLLGLLGAGAGINSASLLGAFLARWGDDLEQSLSEGGSRGLWHAGLGELSRGGIDHLSDLGLLPESVWSRLPDPVRRRCALVMLGEPGGPGLTRASLDRSKTVEPASLRLRALLASTETSSRIEATRAEIKGLATPELRVRRLLELATIDGTDKRAIFAQAVSEETHNSPVQEELYERLEEAGEHRLLREALEAHLCSEQLSQRRRSHLAFQLGHTLEQLDVDPLEAFEAYRTSFQSGQERHEALLHMARLAGVRGDQWEAIRCLEAFMTLSDDIDRRVEAGIELSGLYLAEIEPPDDDAAEYDPYAGPVRYDGGPFGRKAIDLLSRLREETRGTDHEERTVSKLAHAHAKVGSPHHAANLFQEVLATEMGTRQTGDALALADLYCGPLGDPHSAEQILFVLFETNPDNDDILDKLLDVCAECKTLPAACELIDKVARLAAPEVLSAARRRQLLQVLARVLDVAVGHHHKAAAIWSELADGAPDDTEARKLRVRQAQALSHVPGEEKRCQRLMLELQREDPFELAPYEGLESLYEEMDDFTRLRVAQQAIHVLEPETEVKATASGRRKTLPSRAFDESLLQSRMLPEGLRDGVLETLRALEPLAVKIWGDALPTIDALGGRRWRNGELDQVRDFAEMASQTFDLGKIKLYLGDGGPGAPQVFTHSALSMWFHRGMFENAGAEVGRYLGGYAAGLGWSGVASLVHLDGRDLWHLLEAVLIKQTSVGLTEVTDPRSMELINEIGSPFNRSMRRRIVEVATPHLDVLRTAHCEAWPAMIRQLATRAGLVLSGQLSGAMQAILRSREWRGHLHDADTQNRLRKLPEAADLLRFALSDDYLELRHGCGLDSKPSRR